MTKAYFASAVAGTLLLGLATAANAATHRGELLAPAYAARGASVAADCSIHGQFDLTASLIASAARPPKGTS
jgi:hypothetical protein